MADLGQEGLVLQVVIGDVRSQVIATTALRIEGRISNRIELVVAHRDERALLIDYRPHKF